MGQKEKTLQEMDVLIKKRKWKNRLGIVAVTAIVIAIAAVSLGSYIRTRQTAINNSMEDHAQNGNFHRESSVVMATGTTSVGVKAITFAIDFLEDTNLYVEEVYLTNGDSVKAGDKYIKFTEESIADAREELKSAALSAQLAYRSGQISDGESKLQAKYTYDMAMLESQFAKQVYDNTIAQLEADYVQSAKIYAEAQQEYQEYLECVQNNTFYDDYHIAALKEAYEEAKELYEDRMQYWEVTDEELKSGSSENMGTAGMMTLSGSAGGETTSDEDIKEESKSKDDLEEDLEEDTEPKKDLQTDTESNDKSDKEDTEPKKDTNKGTSSSSDGAEFPGFSSMQKQENQDSQNERKWIIKTINLLEQEVEKTEETYTTALKEYEDEMASAELNLQKLLSKLETAKEDFTDAEVSYQKQALNAKTVYETSVAKGKTAQNDYDTQLTSLKDSLDRLRDAQEEADSNLALFEALVGDGYLYTEESGTVLMLMAEEGKVLAGGSMIFAYSNPEQISVSMSVSQEDIAKLYVGEAASVVIADAGTYSGVIETINPIASSNSRTAVSYTVIVNLQGDVSGLDANLTASVIFGEDTTSAVSSKDETSGQGDVPKDLADTIFDPKEDENGQSGRANQETHDTKN